MEIFRDPGAPEDAFAPTDESATEGVLDTATAVGTEQAEQAPESTKDEGHPGEASATDDPGKDKLFAGRYKSVEDLEKGYQELRRQLSKEGTSKVQSVLDAVMGTSPAPAQQAPAPAQQAPAPAQQAPAPAQQAPATPQGMTTEQFHQQVQESMQRDPAGTVMQLSRYMTAQAVQQVVAPLYQRIHTSEMKAAMAELAMRNPDFVDLTDNIAGLLKNRQDLRDLVLRNPAAIEDVYRMAKADLGSAAIEAAKQAGAKGAVEALQRKTAATGVPGGKASGAQREVSEEQAITDMIFAPTRGKGIFDPL